MLPPSWKGDVQKAVKETVNSDREQRKVQQSDAAATIAAAIKTLSDAQGTQTAHEDSNQKINITLNGTTLFLVFLTVIFTSASWWVFSGQLDEMRKVYGPIKTQADAANIGNRAWIAPRFMSTDGPITDGQAIKIRIIYENPGRTPALEVALRIIPRTLSTNDGTPVPHELYDNVKMGTNEACKANVNVYAAATFPASTIAGYQSNFATSDVSLTTKIRARSTVLVIQGCYTYKTLDSPHESPFCQYLEPETGKPPEQWQFRHCADGNDAN